MKRDIYYTNAQSPNYRITQYPNYLIAQLPKYLLDIFDENLYYVENKFHLL